MNMEFFNDLNLKKWQPLMLWSINGLSVLLIIISIYSFYHFWSRDVDQSDRFPAPIAQKSTQTYQKNQLTAPLFGPYLASQADDIPDSALNIQLVGILQAPTKANSTALIQLNDGKQQLFQINDILPGGSKILYIYPNYILIKRSGKIEKLSLPKETLHFLPKPSGIPQ
jgi:type II secretory pathway component PulC